MKKIIIIIIIIIPIIVIGFVIYKNNQPSNNVELPKNSLAQGPKIEVAPELYDFGTVIYGQVTEHTFTITNAGSQLLEILRLSTSCGCTQAEMAEDDKIIQPGQSVPMLVTFDPAVHEDDADLGNVTRIVYIKTNDPNNPEVEVEINALVVK